MPPTNPKIAPIRVKTQVVPNLKSSQLPAIGGIANIAHTTEISQTQRVAIA